DSKTPKTTPMTLPGLECYPANPLSIPRPSPPITATTGTPPAITAYDHHISSTFPTVAATSAPGPCRDPCHAS
ncbi:hypothetical protein C0993_003511, partial [Termitomyces sp. T159_Od127]